MKKLLTFCGLSLILALMSGPAYAVTFGLDIDQDGTVDMPPGEITLSESETMAIDIYVVDWDEPAKGNLCAVLLWFEWDQGSIALDSYSVTDPFWDLQDNTLTAGKLEISHANTTGGAAGPNVYVQTVVIHCLAAGTDWVKVQLIADGGVLMPCVGWGGVLDAPDLDVVVNQTAQPVCGNDIKEGTEECDGTDDAACPGLCQDCTCGTAPPECGDGNLDAGEQCDDGNTTPGDGCDENCIIEECGNGVLQAGEDCESDDDCGAGEVCTDCTCGPEPDCTVDLEIEAVKATPGDASVQVPVSMKNPSDKVLAIETVIRDEDNCLTCTGCTPDPVRAPGFLCFAYEQAFGECKVIMVDPTDPSSVIVEGDGPVFTVNYAVSCATADDCIDLELKDTLISDENQDPVKVCEIEKTDEDICFIICGDVYPDESSPGANDCGDGAVNIFDILEEIDFVLGIMEPSACQALQANVPTSLPPDCVAPDVDINDINIFDVLVIIDKALDKDNCCDHYYFGEI